MDSLRIACLFVPEFPLAASLCAAPALAGRPAATVNDQQILVAATGPARRGGVRAAQSLAQARALLPGLIAHPVDPEVERAARERLLKAAADFSPIVEEEAPGIVYVDLTGIRGERRIAGAMIEKMAAIGLAGRVGIAGGRLTAKVAAQRSGEGATIVPPGEEGRYLSDLPIGLLSPSDRLEEILARWGIRTIGALAALPRKEIAARLGREGVALQKAAEGAESRPLIGRRPPRDFSEGIDFDESLTEMEPFLVLVRQTLERLLSALAPWGLACRRLLLILRLDPAGEEARTLHLPAPTTDLRALSAVLRSEIESRAPRAPVTGLTVTVTPEPLRQVQPSLFGRSIHSPDLPATLLARLSALLGSDRVGSPGTLKGHRPERFAVDPYDPARHTGYLAERRKISLAVRVLRPPVRLKVQTAKLPSSEPVSLASLKEASPTAIAGKVRVASGPWRLEEGWWSEAPAARDYWDVELSEGGIYRIFYDLHRQCWFADGIYG